MITPNTSYISHRKSYIKLHHSQLTIRETLFQFPPFAQYPMLHFLLGSRLMPPVIQVVQKMSQQVFSFHKLQKMRFYHKMFAED